MHGRWKNHVAEPVIGPAHFGPGPLARLEHVPEKHALGLDQTGGDRFSEKGMRSLRNLEHIPIQPNRDML